jgi:uncharacterized membrane protein YbhN (UPF0104 family)
MVRTIGTWLLGFGLIAGLAWLNWDGITETVNRVRLVGFAWHWLGLAFLVYVVSLGITFYRWFVLVRAQELPFGQVDALRLGLVGFFFNNFMPGAIGGDVIKAVFVAREQQKRTVAIATIVVDRVIGLLGLVLLSGLVGVFYWQEAWDKEVLRWILIFVWGVSAGAILGWLAVAILPLPLAELAGRLRRIPVVGRVLAELICCLVMYRDHSRAVVLAMIMAMIGHVGFVGSFYFCSLSFGRDVPSLASQFLVVPIGFVVQAVPLTPGGNLGVGEAVFQKLFEFKVGREKAVAGFLACAAQRLVAWSVAFIGLMCYLPLRSTIRREPWTDSPLSDGQAALHPQQAEIDHEAVPQ